MARASRTSALGPESGDALARTTAPLRPEAQAGRRRSQRSPSTRLARAKIGKGLFERLRRDRRVLLALTFGSTASGSETDLSDTDLCIVLRNDEDLRTFIGEIHTLFKAIGPLVGHYNYSPYHFYVVYRNLIPFDIYCISSSLYFILRASSKQLVLIDQSTRGQLAGSDRHPPTAAVRELLLKAYIRVFRLLSKVQKRDFVTLIFILNSIRDEQLVPLLSFTYGVDIPHAKSIRLDAFPKPVAKLFVQTFPNPTRPSCLKALRAASRLLVHVADTLAHRIGISDLRREILQSEVRIRAFR